MKQHSVSGLLDFINVGAAIKTERYEISAYESMIVLAQELGAHNSAELLRQNLEEEKVALEKLQAFLTQVKPTESGVIETPEGGLPRKAA